MPSDPGFGLWKRGQGEKSGQRTWWGEASILTSPLASYRTYSRLEGASMQPGSAVEACRACRPEGRCADGSRLRPDRNSIPQFLIASLKQLRASAARLATELLAGRGGWDREREREGGDDRGPPLGASLPLPPPTSPDVALEQTGLVVPMEPPAPQHECGDKTRLPTRGGYGYMGLSYSRRRSHRGKGLTHAAHL